MLNSFTIIICFLLISDTASKLYSNFPFKLQHALNVTKEAISQLADEWQIEKYPNFLRSCYMDKTAWKIMKWKFINKIISTEANKKSETFILSFMGSSVTAGHESPFNKSTPIVAGELIRKPFEALDIKVISRNAALGNNPCMPYNLCVKYFTGEDADVVHWEQGYNCGNSLFMYEQFVRQASNLPNKPVIVFSESSTGHWKKSECKTSPHVLSDYDKQILSSDFHHLVHELNQDELDRAWPVVRQLTKEYPKIPIQVFTHVTHIDYACLGPYVPHWTDGVTADYHPSVIGHRLRAAHMAYFWLLILQHAIEECITLYPATGGNNLTPSSASTTTTSIPFSEDTINPRIRKNLERYFTLMATQTQKKLSSIERSDPLTSYPIMHWPTDTSMYNIVYNGSQSSPSTSSSSASTSMTGNSNSNNPNSIGNHLGIVDNMQCYTDYQPRIAEDTSSLAKHSIHGVNPSDPATWKYIIYENIDGPKYIAKNREMGLLDYKYLLHSTTKSGPLSLQLPVKNVHGGPVYVCEPPTIRKQLPPGFYHYFNTSVAFYITYDVPDYASFVFAEANAEIQSYQWFTPPESINVCVQLNRKQFVSSAGVFKKSTIYRPGRHVLTILPEKEKPVLLSWVLFP